MTINETSSKTLTLADCSEALAPVADGRFRQALESLEKIRPTDNMLVMISASIIEFFENDNVPSGFSDNVLALGVMINRYCSDLRSPLARKMIDRKVIKWLVRTFNYDLILHYFDLVGDVKLALPSGDLLLECYEDTRHENSRRAMNVLDCLISLTRRSRYLQPREFDQSCHSMINPSYIPIAANQLCSFPAPPSICRAFFNPSLIKDREEKGLLMLIDRDVLEKRLREMGRSDPELSTAIEKILALNPSEYFISWRITNEAYADAIVIGIILMILSGFAISASCSSGAIKILPLFCALVNVDRYVSRKGGYLSGLVFAICLAQFSVNYADYLNGTVPVQTKLPESIVALVSYIMILYMESQIRSFWICRKIFLM